MKQMLDVIEGLLLVLVAVPVVFIAADAALTYLDAREDNEIVSYVADKAEVFTPAFTTDVVAEQEFWQTAAFALAAWGLAVLFFVYVFRGLRAVLRAVERRQAEQHA